jgi:hypothetical protein
MNTRMLTHVRRCFNSTWVSADINRANRRKWVRSVRQLGDKWLLAANATRVKC